MTVTQGGVPATRRIEEGTHRYPSKIERWRSVLSASDVALASLLLVSLLVRVVQLPEPRNALIFDEVYYVNAARVILGWPVPAEDPYAGAPAGIDPNAEHPPLGKVLIAASMRLLGDDAWGWRLPSILAGVSAIALLYAIVRAAGGDPWLGVIAAGLFSLDNLVLVHSRIATLDMMLLAFLLLGAWLFLRGWPLLGGAACALAALVKLTGVYGLLALFLFMAGAATWTWWHTRRVPVARLRDALLLVAGFLPVWIAGLWLLDRWVTSFATPWEHLRFMLDYGVALTRDGGPLDYESNPWQWLFNEVQMPYLRVDEQLWVGDTLVGTRPVIFFRGAMNPVLIGAAPLAAGYAAWRAWRTGDRLALWTAAWLAGTYLPFYPLSMGLGRISYIFYLLPTLPAVAVAIALLLREPRLPRPAVWAFLAAALTAFVGYFPFRDIP